MMTTSERPTRQRREPSMADVAKLAGVSSQTVSRVSNGHTNVDDATRDRVVAAMRTIGYRPNSAARALRSGRFQNIGVIMFTLSTFGNMRTLDAIATAAAAADYSVTLIPIPDPTLGSVSGAYTKLSTQAVDGVIIIFEAHMIDHADIALPPGLPVVVVDSNAGDEYMVVDNDQGEGARLATEHLISLGHRSIAHIAGPPSSFSAARRVESWQQSLEKAGLDVPEVLHGDWSAESGYRHGLALAAREDVTAIFAANDQMALGAMRALHETGRRVPGDVSVVGFDDMEESKSFWPPLTTVHQDFGEIGRRAMQTLVDEITGAPHRTGRSLVPIRLVVRESTAAPRS